MADDPVIRAAKFKKQSHPAKAASDQQQQKQQPKISDVVDPSDFNTPPGVETEAESRDQGPTAEDLLQLRRYLMSLDSRLAAPDVRERIEKSCQPIDFSQALETGEIRQTVLIRPDLKVIFRTISTAEDVEITKLVAVDLDSPLGEVKRSLYLLTMGTVAINDKKLPDHLDDNRQVDEDLLAKKFAMVAKLPAPVVTVLSLNYQWFIERVEDLFIKPEMVEQVKNG